MSVQNYTLLDDTINLSASYDNSSRKIYFSFTHQTFYSTSNYALFLNENEIECTKYVYAKSDNKLVNEIKENVDYYLKKDDFLVNNIKLDLIVINRDVRLLGFGEYDGIYRYIYPQYYRNDSGNILHKTIYNGKPHWEVKDTKVGHIVSTTDHSSHPFGHSFNEMSHTPVINNINIIGGNLNIEYLTDYELYIK